MRKYGPVPSGRPGGRRARRRGAAWLSSSRTHLRATVVATGPVRVRPVPLREERLSGDPATLPPNYKWMALFISTLGMLMATIDGSIVLISLPNIFRGIGIDPLEPGNTFFLLWMILGFLVVTSVLVVTLGRMGDIYGRVRIYNMGFAVFTFFSLCCPSRGCTAMRRAMWLIVMRIFQGVGAAMLMANSAAILTDVFPDNQRGLALGINQAAAFSGTFIGLVLGGLLAPLNWRLDLPRLGTHRARRHVMGYLELHGPAPSPGPIDWPGNITFAAGLILVMIGITYGIEPYGGHVMGWTNPLVLGALAFGVVLLGVFCVMETHVRPADVPPPAVQDPGLHLRRPRQLPGRPQPGRLDVHADHLAPGDLVAPARLRLHA